MYEAETKLFSEKNVWGFLVFHISHRLKVSIILINFAQYFCLKDGLPPQHYKIQLKATFTNWQIKIDIHQVCLRLQVIVFSAIIYDYIQSLYRVCCQTFKSSFPREKLKLHRNWLIHDSKKMGHNNFISLARIISCTRIVLGTFSSNRFYIDFLSSSKYHRRTKGCSG